MRPQEWKLLLAGIGLGLLLTQCCSMPVHAEPQISAIWREMPVQAVEPVNEAEAVEPVAPAPSYEDPVAEPPVISPGEALAEYALSFAGKTPYVWGGESLQYGCDCSGFTRAIYARWGIDLPHYDVYQRAYGIPVALEDIKPGDIVCYSGHVGIYVGNGLVVSARNRRLGVATAPVGYRPIVTIRRIL